MTALQFPVPCALCAVHTRSQDLQKYSVQRHAINKATLSGSLQTGISLEFIEFTMSETAAEMPARFIAAVYLLLNTEQNFLRFLATFLFLDMHQRHVLPFKFALHLQLVPLSSH